MATVDFFRARIDAMINLNDPLAVLARRLPWDQIEEALAPMFARRDRPGVTSPEVTCSARAWWWLVADSTMQVGPDCRCG